MQPDTENDNADFLISADHTLILYLGSDMDAVIPDGVVSVADYAFNHVDHPDSITIPDSVTSLSGMDCITAPS